MKKILILLVISLFLLPAGCENEEDSSNNLLLLFGANRDTWTWVSGSDIRNQSGIYGVKGTANSANMPGGRYDAVCWSDSSGNLWLFGGYGYDSVGTEERLNDLWKYDGTYWTWISGSDTIGQSGTYGTRGVADSSNVPGARRDAISWIDSSGNLWLFGGRGYDSAGDEGRLNDLWKFDGTNWTWVSGSDTINQKGTYGTRGVADPSNVPGARYYSISWIDSSDNLWLFGGSGYDSVPNFGRLNDLWKFDGANWTWESGSNIYDEYGTYGTKGVADSSNIPGGRYSSVSWIDKSGNLWLFGGWGWDFEGNEGRLNDLWKYDGANWTWMSGTKNIDQNGIYGTKGEADSLNIPGARMYAISWIDRSGNLWLFGGAGYDSAGSLLDLNDLWKYNGTDWIWVSGSSTGNQKSIYGTLGVADSSNMPGCRRDPIRWIDKSGNLWLLGGNGKDTNGNSGYLNDLWRYRP